MLGIYNKVQHLGIPNHFCGNASIRMLDEFFQALPINFPHKYNVGPLRPSINV